MGLLSAIASRAPLSRSVTTIWSWRSDEKPSPADYQRQTTEYAKSCASSAEAVTVNMGNIKYIMALPP